MTNPKVFLLSMEIGGIKNLEKPVKVNFYKETIDKDFDPSEYRIKGIYGENGVGKSALMSGVYFYKGLLMNGRFLSSIINDEKIKYLLNKKTKKASFTFEFLIVFDKEHIMIYKHLLELSKNDNDILEITKEEAYKKSPGSNYRNIYVCNNGILKFNIESKFFKEFTEATRNTLKERTVISSLMIIRESNTIEIENSDLNNILNFAAKLYIYINDNEEQNEFLLRKHSRTSLDIFKELVQSVPLTYFTCSNRTLIDEDELDFFKKCVQELKLFIKIYKPDLKDIIIDEKPDRGKVSCSLIFHYKDYDIDGKFESTGIKRLVELFISFRNVSNGNIVFIDELDANIHDYYLCRLLEYVAEYTDGQLCFTSHNLGPMEVLKDYKKSIDFLSRDGEIFPWIKNGNYNVANQYKEGKIKNFPFNIDSFDFIKVFGDGE